MVRDWRLLGISDAGRGWKSEEDGRGLGLKGRGMKGAIGTIVGYRAYHISR